MKLINERFEIVGNLEQVLNYESYKVKDLKDNQFKRLTFYKYKKHKNTIEYLINNFLELSNINHKLLLNADHFHIVEKIDSKKENRFLYFLIHELESGELLHLCKKDLKDREKINLVVELMNLMDHLHFRGIIYKYLSPDNIFIDKNNDLKVRDLGFVCEINIHTGYQSITENFISPEIYNNIDGIDKKSDYYSIGVILKYLFIKDYKAQNININDFTETTSINKAQKEVLLNTINNLTQKYPFNRNINLRTHIENIEKAFNLDYKYDLANEREKINYQVKLQGRNEEITKIIENDNLLDRENGAYNSILVTGQKGSGKSRFLREIDFKLRMNGRQIIRIDVRNDNKRDRDNISELLKASLLLASDELKKKYKSDFKGKNFYETSALEDKALDYYSPKYKAKYKFFNRITNYFKELAKNEILYILIDNIQESDKDFMDLLKYIMINLKNKSIVLVTSYLELSITFDCKIKDQLEEWIANDKMLKITLHELEKEDFKKIMKSKFGYSQNHQNLINFLYDITGGNLLKLNYIIDELYNKNDIYMNENGNWNTSVKDYEDIFIHLDIHDTLKEQLKEISEETLEFIKLASIFNKYILEESIIEIMGIDISKKEEILKELLDRQIIKKFLHSSKKVYVFHNIELKKLLYHEMNKSEKNIIHTNMANIMLKNTNIEDRFILEELAFQLMKSDREDLGLDIILKKAMDIKSDFSDESLYLWELAYSLIQNDLKYQRKKKTLKILEELIDIYSLKRENIDLYNYIEELNKIAIVQKNDFYFLKSKYYKAEYYILRNKLDDAKLYIKEIFKLSDELGIYQGRLMALYLESKVYLEENIWDSLLETSKEIISICKSHKLDEFLGNTYNILGIYYKYNNKLEESINSFKESIKIFHRINNIGEIIKPINNLGEIYLDHYNDEKKALKLYERGYKLSKKYNLVVGISLFSLNMGIVYLEKLELDRALLYFKEANKIFNRRKDFRGIFVCNIKIALVYLKKEDIIKLNHYNNIINDIKKNNIILDRELKGIYYKYTSRVFGYFGNWDKALENIVIAKDLYRESNIKEYKKSILKEIYFISRKKEMIQEEHKEIVCNLLKDYLKMGLNNGILLIVLNLCEISLLNKDMEFSEKIMGLYNKLRFEDELESLKILRKSIESNIDINKGIYVKINNVDLDNYSLGIRHYYHLNQGINLFDKKDYKISIYHFLESLGVILEKVELIKDPSLKIEFIKSTNGDLIKTYISKSIELAFNKKITYLKLSQINEENIYEYFNTDSISKYLNDYQIDSIFYAYKKNYKIKNLEELIYLMNDNYKYNLDNILKYMADKTLAQKGFIILHDRSINEYKILSSIKEEDIDTFNFNKLVYLDREKNGVFINKNSLYREDTTGFLSKENMAVLGVPIRIDTLYPYSKDNRSNKKISDEKYRGFVYLETRDYVNKFNEENFKMVKSISKLIYLNLENHMLKNTSNIDKLTNTMTRKCFDSYLEKYIENYYNNDLEFTLLMIDVDDFKDINDGYGHLKGDQTLKLIGRELKNSVRSTDLVSRYGGDEFIIVLLNTKLHHGEQIAEKIRSKIEETKVKGVDKKITLTIGVSHFPTHGNHKKALIERSDQALCFAKENLGKNSVAVWDQSFLKEDDEVDDKEDSSNEILNIDDKVALTVAKTTNLIMENLNLEEKGNIFLEILLENLKAEEAHLIFMEGNRIKSSIIRNRDKDNISKTSKYKLNIISKALSHKKAEIFIDWESYDTINPITGAPDWKSIIYIPLIKNGDVKGIVYVSISINEKEFNRNDFNLVKLISNIFLANF